MPQPGDVRAPEYKAGESLPWGGATQANRADRAPSLFTPDTPPPPATPEDQFIFGPTMRPNEPVTAGAPFGPGPMAPSVGPRNIPDSQFLRDAVARMAPQQQSLPPRVQEFLSRVEAGE